VIEQIIQTLSKIQFQSELNEVFTLLSSQGLRLVQNVGRRHTFQDAGGQKYSFYLRKDGRIRCVEVTFYARFDTESLSSADYQRLVDEMMRHYEDALNRVIALQGIGRDFLLGNEVEMPHQRDAVRLTLWSLSGADLMLELKYEGRDVPIRLVLSLVPE